MWKQLLEKGREIVGRNESQFLDWRKRPKAVAEMINIVESASKERYKNYIFEFTPDYRLSSVSAMSIVRSLLEDESTEQPLRCLDVGAGAGVFLNQLKETFRNRVATTGLSLHDYRELVSLTSENIERYQHEYVLGNLEKAEVIFNGKSFDFITSHQAFEYAVDPLGALEQLYELLSPNGILFIDSIHCSGIAEDLLSLVHFLLSKGYLIAADYDFIAEKGLIKIKSIRSLCIKKTHAHLELPVQYGRVNNKGNCEYKLSPQVSPVPISIPAELQDFLKQERQVVDPTYDGLLAEKSGISSSNFLNTAPPREMTYPEYLDSIIRKFVESSDHEELKSLLPLMREGLIKFRQQFSFDTFFRRQVETFVSLNS